MWGNITNKLYQVNKLYILKDEEVFRYTDVTLNFSQNDLPNLQDLVASCRIL
jgi:hypothetical protein